jgi:hypothetical protein
MSSEPSELSGVAVLIEAVERRDCLAIPGEAEDMVEASALSEVARLLEAVERLRCEAVPGEAEVNEVAAFAATRAPDAERPFDDVDAFGEGDEPPALSEVAGLIAAVERLRCEAVPGEARDVCALFARIVKTGPLLGQVHQSGCREAGAGR